MKSLQNAIASAWQALNPSEPSPKYLAVFMGSAILLFVAAYLIGTLI